MSLADKLASVLARHDELRDALGGAGLPTDQFVKLSKEYAELTPVADAVNELKKAQDEQADAQALLADPEFQAEAKRELEMLKQRVPELEKQVQKMLLPKDIADDRNAILEIRAGAGGDEAALFGTLLFDMYRKYAAIRGWRFEVLDLSENDLGGIKEGSALISGKGVFRASEIRIRRASRTTRAANGSLGPRSHVNGQPSPCWPRWKKSMCKSTSAI